jgi:cysteine synthase B
MAGIIDFVGNTPLVEIQKMNPYKNVQLFLKLEGNNPGGSVKDRAALNMIRSAIERGEIKAGSRLVEATSGNTGIALAMVSRIFDLELEIVLPKNSTIERIQTMQAYGATVVLLDTIEACRDYAIDRAANDGFFLLDQFANPDNYMAHYKTTGPELWRDTDGKITHFVSSMGTTGTIMGCSRYLKEKNSAIRIVGCQPVEGSSIPGIRRWPEAYLPKIFDKTRVDQIIDVSEAEATAMTRRLAKEEGIFAGMSTGGGFVAALKLASTLSEGLIVSIACDRGDRYLSSNLYEKS